MNDPDSVTVDVFEEQGMPGDGEDLELEKDPLEPLEYDDGEVNLVPIFMGNREGEEAVDNLSRQAIDHFDSGWSAMEEYRAIAKRNWRLYAGELPKKTYPFKDCANVHIPMFLENMTRIATRVYSEIFRDGSNVCAALPVNEQHEAEADIVTKHTNWQFREQIPSFAREQERAIICYLSVGDVIVHSFHDLQSKQNRHETLTTDDFVMPYAHVTTQPDLSDLPWYCKVRHIYRHDLQGYRDIWEGVDEFLDDNEPSHEATPEDPFAEEISNIAGLEKPESDDDSAPYKVLLYYGWTKHLPGQRDDRFVEVVVDHSTGHVFSIKIYEEADWKDRQRYEQQVEELKNWRNDMAQYEGAVQSSMSIFKAQKEGGQVPPDAEMPPPPSGPTPPGWLKEGQADDISARPDDPPMRPVHMFAHGVCMESLAGSLGLGFGRIQGDMNIAINTLANQGLDAMTMNNVWSVIVADGVQFTEPFEISPGKVNRARGVSGAQLRDSIYELKPGPASQQMMQMLEMIYGWGQSSMSSPAVLSGESGKSGETWRGLSERVEQATKQMSHVSSKYGNNVLLPVVRNNSKLNAVYMPDEEIFLVASDEVQYAAEPVSVGRKMYTRTFKYELRSDLRFTSEQQRRKEADELYKMAAENPYLLEGKPMPPMMYETMKGTLEARRAHHLIRYLGPNPEEQQKMQAEQQAQQQAQPAPQPGQPPGPPPQQG